MAEVTQEWLVDEPLRGGQMWSRVLKRGQVLRITDVEGGGSVAALLFNADRPLERYNMPDTLKAQHIARITTGNVLYSDMGRILCSITGDSVGWHDPIGGCSNARIVREPRESSLSKFSRPTMATAIGSLRTLGSPSST